jgi:hypothetical protein
MAIELDLSSTSLGFGFSKSYVLAQPGDDYIAQCYAWLHNQPEFVGGEAV